MKTYAWLHTAVLSLAAAIIIAGCGGGSSSKPVTTDDFCTQKAEQECQVAVKCANSATACQAQRKTLCLQFVAATMTATRPFRPENIARCINQTKTVYAKSTITPTDLAAMNDACQYVFQGSVAKDGACTTKYDCAGNVICDMNGLCETQVNTGSGQACNGPGAVCNTGLYCTGTPVPRCAAKKVATDACDDTTPCVENLRCVGAVCQAKVMPSDPCTSDDDCPTAAPYCDPYVGNKCDSGLAFTGGAPACVDYGGNATATDGGGTQDSGAGG